MLASLRLFTFSLSYLFLYASVFCRLDSIVSLSRLSFCPAGVGGIFLSHSSPRKQNQISHGPTRAFFGGPQKEVQEVRPQDHPITIRSILWHPQPPLRSLLALFLSLWTLSSLSLYVFVSSREAVSLHLSLPSRSVSVISRSSLSFSFSLLSQLSLCLTPSLLSLALSLSLSPLLSLFLFDLSFSDRALVVVLALFLLDLFVTPCWASVGRWSNLRYL